MTDRGRARPRPSAYVRRIVLTAPDDATVTADLEDDFHRFGLLLRHDGHHVVSCEGDAVRYPWTECPGAIEPLRAVAGLPLNERGSTIADHVSPSSNCTHLFDLAALAVGHAAARRSRREYFAVVPDRDDAWRTTATLRRDGEVVLEWQLERLEVRSEGPFQGLRLRGGFQRWTSEMLDADQAESALVLRRACEISMGRNTPWDRLPAAIDVGEFMLGVCHTFQPGRAEVALRVKGSTRDFSQDPSLLLEA